MSPDGAPERAESAAGAAGAAARGRRRRVVGQVVSNRMQKTIRVRADRLLPHPRYKKYIRRSTVYFAHDENGEAHPGDTVEIMETRPISKQKRWRLVRVVGRAVGSEEEPKRGEGAS